MRRTGRGGSPQAQGTDRGSATTAPASQPFPLNAWAAGPDRCRRRPMRTEAYGYAASAELIRLIAARTGADGLRAVVAAAVARPAGTLPTDWRGLLDLLETEAGVDATDLWRTWVVRPEDAALLDARATGRFEQAALVREEANGWVLPAAIDANLDAWRFDEAQASMTEARTLLEARDDLAVAAAVAGLEPPPNLRRRSRPAIWRRPRPRRGRAGDRRPDRRGRGGRRRDVVVLARPGRPARAGSDRRARRRPGRVQRAGDLSAAQARAIGARETWTAAADLGGLRLRIDRRDRPRRRARRSCCMATRARRHPRRPTRLRDVVGRDRGRLVPAATLPSQPSPEWPGPAGDPEPTVQRADRHPTGPGPRLMGILRVRPSNEILSGESADVYFARAESILEREGLDPMVVMEVFSREAGILCGIDEAKNLIAHVLGEADPSEVTVEALDDGDTFAPKEVVLRIRARYRRFGLYETAILGMLAQSTGWATAARECVEAAAPRPVISFGARHVHPDVTDVLDYAAIVGGCVGASTPAGARLAGLNPTGTMPHSLVLIFGDTVEAAIAFDRDLGPDVPRIVLIDTFKDEAEEALRVAHALGDRLYGIRLDTPSERGRVTADLVTEIRARLDLEGFEPRQDRRVGRPEPGPDPLLRREPARRSTRTPSARTSAARRRSTSPATSRRSTGGRSPSAAGSPVGPRARDSGRSTSPAWHAET